MGPRGIPNLRKKIHRWLWLDNEKAGIEWCNPFTTDEARDMLDRMSDAQFHAEVRRVKSTMWTPAMEEELRLLTEELGLHSTMEPVFIQDKRWEDPHTGAVVSTGFKTFPL